MTARIAPAVTPFSEDIQAWLSRTMPDGLPPLVLFTTLARDERLFKKFFAGGLLDRGHLTLRQREIVIDRTTALCRSEYEWGVHVSLFGRRVGLTAQQLRSLVHGNASDECWSDEERLLLRLCDELHASSALTDASWDELRAMFTEEALLELLLLAGFYRTVSYLTNALKLPLEPFGARFPEPNPRREGEPSRQPGDDEAAPGMRSPS
ncbi:carboxymuconolactone decarboxylase family protein [uncultured Piscinibacter sp.]|uniref:carboxymuconolactone decarboxylase family protein n=1 Tax=uncultured Piscinibacter sp. TaxID=1131835 RepID=UPI0026212300|nr:carboxymuconolactone decarboxylase family protein [uncultured Piscinibacter sp.]